LFRHPRRADGSRHADGFTADGAAAPAWFEAALEQKPEHFDVEVDDCRIHVRAWGDTQRPPLILVHGGGAHSGWWDHVAPFFTRTHRVIAPDLSGHGDSERRQAYHLTTWAREVLAAQGAAGATGQPTIIGHSMGGWVASTAATHFGGDIDSIVVIDSPLRDRAPEASQLRGNKQQHPTGYRSKDEIVARFKAVPTQDVILPYVGQHIAQESVCQTAEGWFWKFDRAIFSGPLFERQTTADQEAMEAMMAQMPCRIGFLRCEAGLVPPAMADKIRSILELRGPFIELAEAGHHPMLDQPLPLVASLRALLELWSIT
jgi:pimeloyl-ACP methyl ester carboxylesterase